MASARRSGCATIPSRRVAYGRAGKAVAAKVTWDTRDRAAALVKVAFFSPMPPERSGIADYSALLLPALRERCEVVVVERGAKKAPARDRPLRLPRRQQPRGPRLDRRGAAPHAGRRRPARLRSPPPRRRPHDRPPRRPRLPRRDGARGRRRRAAARPCRPRQAHPAAVGEPAGGLPSRRARCSTARPGSSSTRRYVRDRARAAGYDGPDLDRAASRLPGSRSVRRSRSRAIRCSARSGTSTRASGCRSCSRRSRASGATRPDARPAARRRRLAGLRPRSAAAAARARRRGLVREGYVDEARLWALMKACDVHVSLRSPTMGETSGHRDPRARAREAARRQRRRLVRRAARTTSR